MVLSPADTAEDTPEYQPLLAFIVISQPGLARRQIYYPLISLQIAKSLQVRVSVNSVYFVHDWKDIGDSADSAASSSSLCVCHNLCLKHILYKLTVFLLIAMCAEIGNINMSLSTHLRLELTAALQSLGFIE